MTIVLGTWAPQGSVPAAGEVDTGTLTVTLRILRISIPTPFPVGPVNAYLLPDDPITLVDTGVKTVAARAAIEEGFAAADVPLAALRRIVLTHAHTDHMGLAASLAAETGATVFAHPDDASKLTGARALVDHLLRALRQHGAPETLGPTVLETLGEFRRLIDPVLTFTPLAEGMGLACGGETLEILHTPGHSAGHICLFSRGRLIAGDVLLEEISPNPLLEFTAEGRRVQTLPLLLSSLQRLHALNPTEVYPGHGVPFGPAAPRIESVLAHHAQRLTQIAGLLRDVPQPAFTLAGILFPEVDPMNRLLSVSEVIGHLDLLVADGRAVEIEDGERILYRRNPD